MASGIYRQVYTSWEKKKKKKKHICYDRSIPIPRVTPLSHTLIQIRFIDLINNSLLKQISPPRENKIKRESHHMIIMIYACKVQHRSTKSTTRLKITVYILRLEIDGNHQNEKRRTVSSR